jgi:hypothetical protein
MKEVKQNEKDVKAAIVAANNHYGGYGPGTVDIFRQNMDMEKLSFENVDITKINQDLELETKFNFSDLNLRNKDKQTSISDFVN